MKIRKKALAFGLILAVGASLTACGSKDENAENTIGSSEASEPVEEDIRIRISWWGSDSMHEATVEAVKRFMEDYPNINVELQYGIWDMWEMNMTKAFAKGKAPDVNQIEWRWISELSPKGETFADMREYSDIFDLSQYSQSALDMCTVAGELQAIPVSVTGRIFCWNRTTFDKAGISTPTSLKELYAAGETFQNVLGDDYYPLLLNADDRMSLMVYYLESVYGKAWLADNELQYTQEEIEKGLEFIQSLEEKHVIPSIQMLAEAGAAAPDENAGCLEGKYAGVFVWDYTIPELRESLAESGQELVAGDYFRDMGEYQGGYTKVAFAFAISETSEHKEECALLLNYLLNEDAGTGIMAGERGIPLSSKAFESCSAQGLLDTEAIEAHQKVLDWVGYSVDPGFEAAPLSSPDGVYYAVMAGLSSGNYSVSDAAAALIAGINEVHGKE